jgi:hypothetical protein
MALFICLVNFYWIFAFKLLIAKILDESYKQLKYKWILPKLTSLWLTINGQGVQYCIWFSVAYS